MSKKKKENLSDTSIIRSRVDNILTFNTLDIKKPDYHKKLKKICEAAVKTKNKFDPLINSYEIEKTVLDKDYDEVFKRNAYYQKRRITALTQYVPHFTETFKTRYPELSIGKTVLDLTVMSSTNLPDSTFATPDGVDTRWLTLAIVIFILDDLRENDTIEEALLYLPEAVDIKMMSFRDCMFDEDVIKSMIYLIENKDNEHGCLLSRTAAKRTRDTVTARQYIKTSIPDEENDKTSEIKSKIYKSAQSMTYRERLDKILSLMSPETVEKAEKCFISKLHEYLNIILRYDSKVWPEIEEQLNVLVEMCNKFDDVEAQTNKYMRANTLPAKNSCLCDQMPSLDIQRPAASVKAFTDMCKQLSDINNLYDAFNKASTNLNNQQRAIAKAISDRNTDLFYFLNGCNPAIACQNDEVRNIVKSFHIANPYEICFAYFELLDSGHDIIWLVEIAAAILSFAARQLPWLNIYNRKLKEKINENDTANEEKMNDKMYTKQNAYLYAQKYTDFFAWRAYDAVDPNQEDLLPYNLAQIMFSVNNMLLPRKLETFADKKLNDGFVRSGIDSSNVDTMSLMLEFTNRLCHKISLPYKQTDTPNTIALKKTISEKNEKISELTDSLKNAEKKLKTEQARIEDIMRSTEAEQKELFELRELVYQLQNNSTDTTSLTSNDCDITLPYTPHMRLVIYGGHATWLKAMRQFLPTVKIIEPNENPDVNLVRNADAIWMQTNAMPHSYYGKIMDIARQRKIPIKYFTYGSAERCAKQLAEYDTQNERTQTA